MTETERQEVLTRLARERLRDLMSEWSENWWCAGWHSGTEEKLWDLIETGTCGDKYAYNPHEIAEIREARDAVQGWYCWNRDIGHLEFVTLAEWAEMRKAAGR